MRKQAEGAERAKRERVLEEQERCSFHLSATADSIGPHFRRGILATARGRPVQRPGGLQPKETEAGEGLWQRQFPLGP